MIYLVAVGIGAGLVSALLFSVVVTGSPLGVLLSYVAPLPVLIAALGWNHRSGLVAAATGAVVTALVFQVSGGIAYAIGSGLPAWWLAYLALLGRPQPDGSIEWYPLGRLLLWIALTAALITLVGVLALGGGDDEAYRATLREAMESVIRFQRRAGEAAPSRDALLSPGLMAVLIAAVPVIAASLFAMVLTLNVWIAARVVSMSNRLPRPWPLIPTTAMPRQALALLGGAIVLSFLPGLAGVAGLALVGGVATAFSLQGLALIHFASRGRQGRGAMLGLAYLLVVFVGHTLLPLLALVGMADTALGWRQRMAGGGPKSPHP